MKCKISAVFAALFLAVILTSCGSKGKNIVPVELWYGATFSEAGEPPADWEVFNIIRRKLNIELKISAVPASSAEADKKITAAAEAGRLPDIFVVSGTVLPKLMKKECLSYVDDMYELMPTRTSQMYDVKERKSYGYKGKHYALSQPGSVVKNEGVLIRKDWLDKLGLEIPVTLDDYMNVMKAFTYNDPDGNGKNDTYGYGAYLEIKKNSEGLGSKFDPIFGAFGVEGTFDFNKDTAGLNIYKDSYFDAVNFVRQMVSEKVIDPNWVVYKKDDFRNAWKSGRFGIMREQNAAFALENNYAPFDERFPDGEWIVIEPPTGPTGVKSVGIYTDQGHRIYAISKNAREKGKIEAIARLLEWMSSDEGYYLLGFGEEGVNYRRDENGKITTEGLADPSKAYTQKSFARYLQLRNLIFYNSEVELESRYPTWISRNGKKMSAYTVLKDMQSQDWTPALGSEGLPAPSTEVKKYYEQGVMDFVTGKRVLIEENWQQWLNGFTRIGGIDWERKCKNYVESNNLLTE